MSARNKSSERRPVAGNPQFPGAVGRISRRLEFSMAERRQPSTRRAVAGNPQFPGGGVDRISGLADDMLGQILSFLPAMEAIRSSVLSRRWRRAWTHVPDLKISDELHQERFLDFADAVLAQYGTADIPFPSLNVAIGCQSNLGPGAATWLRNAMERVVGSIRVHMHGMDQLVLPCSLQAKTMTLDLSKCLSSTPVLIFPEPVDPAAFGRLAELSLSNLQLQRDGFGEFLSSCFPQLRKLRLHNVHNVTDEEGLWPLILHSDMLEELQVRIYQLKLLHVVAPKLRLLTVSGSFESLSALFTANTLAKISAPGLEAISWSGCFPKRLDFLTDPRCVRRLAGLHVYWPSISRTKYYLPYIVQFLETCSGADQLRLSLHIVRNNPPMSEIQDFMGRIPCLPNITTLSLKIVAILRWLRGSICPGVFSILRRCPNLTLLHVDLSTLHQWSDLHPHHLVFPDDDDDDDDDDAKPSKGRECHSQNPPKDQIQLGSLQKIRISSFVGTDTEMELAELLFGVGAARPALERISISSFPQLSGRMNRITLKLKARFPLSRGCWETFLWGEIMWTKKKEY